MAKRLSPQEKKGLAYEGDHYVSANESRHAFRKNWPKKKAMLNQQHRHQVKQAIYQMEKIGEVELIESSGAEVTAEQIRKPHPKTELHKWGVKSLKEYVTNSREWRERRAGFALKNQDRRKTHYQELITALERDPHSLKSRELKRAIGFHDCFLRDFLRDNPEWRTRLNKKLKEIDRVEKKAERKRQNKEAEKLKMKALHKAIQKQIKSQSH